MAKAPKKGNAPAPETPAGVETGAAIAPSGDASGAELAGDGTGEALPPVEEVAEPTPAAPGEDREAVHDRRLERLERIVEEAQFESGTALGDLVNCLVDIVKHRPAWGAMDQREQRDTIRTVETACKAALKKVVVLVAQDESEVINATMLAQFTVKGEAIEGKFKIDHVDADLMLAAYALAGHPVVIISADDKRFASKRGEIETMPDQLGLKFEGKVTTVVVDNEIRTAPPGDSDLAGEEALFRVVDPDPGEDGSPPLFLEADEEKWTDVLSDAGSWPLEKAEELARTHVAEVSLYEAPAEEPTPDRTHGEDSAIDDEAEELDPDRLRDDAQERERLERENPTPAED